MGSLTIATVVVFFALLSALCGGVSLAVLQGTNVGRSTAYGWGAALGPIGVIVAVALRTRSWSARGAAPEPWA